MAADLGTRQAARIRDAQASRPGEGVSAVRLHRRIGRRPHAVDADRLGDALQRDEAAVVRVDLVPVHGQPDGLGEDHLARTGQAEDAGGDVHRLAEDVALVEAHFPDVRAGPDLDPVPFGDALVPVPDAVLHGRAAEDGLGGRLEGDEKSAAHGLHPPPVEGAEHRDDERLVEPQHALALLVRQAAQPVGIADDLGEHDGEVGGSHGRHPFSLKGGGPGQ
jgi:hypothetical protein